MQVILLSGGSGTRLWPISNNARSKQFLRLLDRGDGTLESMLQRVVRQLEENGIDGNITIATNSAQHDIISNQLGPEVGVVTEPQRRNTFPAIALSAAHLFFDKGCSEQESVIVMPCDGYTEEGYFRTLSKMDEQVRQDSAKIVLMGIKPTYPSEKYGYIVPKSGSGPECYPVGRFTEKPDSLTASKLIMQNAFWNGGVFGFKLGYIMEKIRDFGDFKSFGDVLSHYSDFPSISFDYQVVEKEQSLCVVPYNGKWEDLGTWNSLCQALPSDVIGNAVIGPGCQGVNVVNELRTPILVEGLKDAVVAACPDGILVCDKKSGENIKVLAEKLVSRPMFEERRWGKYQVLDDTIHEDGSHSLTKILELNPGKGISYQVHRHRSEVWTVVCGTGYIVLDGEMREVKVGDSFVIPVGQRHCLKARTKLKILEVQIGDPLVEEDIERFEWKWNV